MSAYDTLLQELNVLYEVNLNIEQVKWKAIKDKLPNNLRDLMKKERDTEWFKDLAVPKHNDPSGICADKLIPVWIRGTSFGLRLS